MPETKDDGVDAPLVAAAGLSLRFPAAATDGYFNTGGHEGRMQGDGLITTLTRDDETPADLVTDGDVIPIVYVPEKPQDPTLKARWEKMLKVTVFDGNPKPIEQPYWKSCLLYKQRPNAILRLLTLDCLFQNDTFSLTRAQWIWIFNFLCLCLHTTMAVLTFMEGAKNPEGMKVPIWRMSQNWTDTSASGYTVALVDNGYVACQAHARSNHNA